MEIKLTPEEEKLFDESIALNGTKSQMEQYQEECMEGALAVRKLYREIESGTITSIESAKANLADEVADTLIMSIQLRKILGPIVDERIEYKLMRQMNRVEKKKERLSQFNNNNNGN